MGSTGAGAVTANEQPTSRARSSDVPVNVIAGCSASGIDARRARRRQHVDPEPARRVHDDLARLPRAHVRQTAHQVRQRVVGDREQDQLRAADHLGDVQHGDARQQRRRALAGRLRDRRHRHHRVARAAQRAAEHRADPARRRRRRRRAGPGASPGRSCVRSRRAPASIRRSSAVAPVGAPAPLRARRRCDASSAPVRRRVGPGRRSGRPVSVGRRRGADRAHPLLGRRGRARGAGALGLLVEQRRGDRRVEVVDARGDRAGRGVQDERRQPEPALERALLEPEGLRALVRHHVDAAPDPARPGHQRPLGHPHPVPPPADGVHPARAARGRGEPAVVVRCRRAPPRRAPPGRRTPEVGQHEPERGHRLVARGHRVQHGVPLLLVALAVAGDVDLDAPPVRPAPQRTLRAAGWPARGPGGTVWARVLREPVPQPDAVGRDRRPEVGALVDRGSTRTRRRRTGARAARTPR